MKIKKDLIIAVLATFCLTATLFMIRPTLSNPGTTSRLAANQWTDINDDGTVNILDAILLSNDYLATTDPIKNVNVTNFPWQQNVYITNWPLDPEFNTPLLLQNSSLISGAFSVQIPVYVGGYSRMSLSIEVRNCSYQAVTIVTNISLIAVNWGGSWGYEYPPTPLNVVYDGWFAFPEYSQQIPLLFETKYSSCVLWFKVYSEAVSGWIEWRPVVYLRDE